MYYWKTEDLSGQIKEGNIGETEKKNYYIIATVITTASMYMAIGSGTTDSLVTLVECIALIAIVVVGINITFNSNGGGGGQDYIARIAMLSVPILIKLFVFSILVGFGLGVVIASSGETDINVNQWGMTVISVVVQLLYFWRLNIHLCHINT